MDGNLPFPPHFNQYFRVTTAAAKVRREDKTWDPARS